MSRDRLPLGNPVGVDGPWLAAILDVLDGIAATLNDMRDRMPGGAVEPVKVSEPAPDQPPTAAETAPVDDNPDRPLTNPPPRAGRGASADAWREWADLAGVTVPDGASRADIIAACERAGVLSKEQ